MHIRRILALGGLIVLTGAGCASNVDTPVQTNTEVNSSRSSASSADSSMTLAHPGILPDEEIQNKLVRISTDKGDIVFKMYPDTAPLTVSNFVYLAKQGFYNGVTFHRVVNDFVIQGGDPTGSGSGGPGYRFEDELGADHIPADLLDRMNADPAKSLYQRGIVAMANAGPNTNGSQFFVMLDSIPSANMPNLYSIFGEVTEGMDVVDQIVQGDVMNTVTIEDLPVAE